MSQRQRRAQASWISSSNLAIENSQLRKREDKAAGRQRHDDWKKAVREFRNHSQHGGRAVFLVNLLAVQREHAAKAAATASLELTDATNQVRFQMMQNRLYLSNYLLSGDTREVERMNEGLRTLADKLQQGQGAL